MRSKIGIYVGHMFPIGRLMQVIMYYRTYLGSCMRASESQLQTHASAVGKVNKGASMYMHKLVKVG